MKIGIIGGSGLYDMEGLQHIDYKELTTPFGPPSDVYVSGRLNGREVYFLPRHGRGHRLLPSEINYKANIFGFKMLGVERVLSVSAVGSLKEEIRPRDIMLPDQYFDRTKGSLKHTFFGNGIVAHISFAEPACAELRGLVAAAARNVIDRQPEKTDTRVNESGTYVNMEGPAFSTRAESRVYRGLGFDVIGMTSLPEAKLCREAEICYQALAMVTDYDCWHESEESVTVDMVVGHLMANTRLAQKILRELVPNIPEKRECNCANALQHAVLTSKDSILNETRKTLGPIISKYL